MLELTAMEWSDLDIERDSPHSIFTAGLFVGVVLTLVIALLLLWLT